MLFVLSCRSDEDGRYTHATCGSEASSASRTGGVLSPKHASHCAMVAVVAPSDLQKLPEMRTARNVLQRVSGYSLPQVELSMIWGRTSASSRDGRKGITSMST